MGGQIGNNCINRWGTFVFYMYDVNQLSPQIFFPVFGLSRSVVVRIACCVDVRC